MYLLDYLCLTLIFALYGAVAGMLIVKGYRHTFG